MTTKYAVVDKGVLGAFSQFQSGPFAGKWRFIPYCQHQPSRKAWDTPEQALPNWARTAVIVEAETAKDAGEIAARMPKHDWQRLNALSYSYGYDTPNAQLLGRAAQKLQAYDELVDALRELTEARAHDALKAAIQHHARDRSAVIREANAASAARALLKKLAGLS